jgi:hypothetical protein
VRQPGAVRGVILHEPGLYALVDDFDAVRAPIRALVQEANEAGGPSAAVERFWCYVVEDENGWNRLAPTLRERLRATASTLFRCRAGDLRAVPTRRGDVGVAWRAGAPPRQRGRPSLFRRDRRPPRHTLGRRRRDDAGAARRVSRIPLRIRRGVRPFLREVSE